MIEAGFVGKWLSDIVQESSNMELKQEGESQKAIIDFAKLQGGLVALGVGLLIGLVALISEMLYWRWYNSQERLIDRKIDDPEIYECFKKYLK